MKKDYKKFYTPDNVAELMAYMLSPEPNGVYLEPHAGGGALVSAIKRQCKLCTVVAVEKNEDEAFSLKREKADIVITKDFLQFESIPTFSGIVDNPPFGNGIDFGQHFYKMYSHVKNGGKIITIAPRDYTPDVPHGYLNIENWSKNSDGSTTPIKIIYLTK